MPTLSSCFISILLGSWYSRGKIELNRRSFSELVYYLGMNVEEYLRGNCEISQTSFVEDAVEASFFSPHFSPTVPSQHPPLNPVKLLDFSRLIQLIT